MRVVKVSEATGPVLDWMVAKCDFDAPTVEGGVVHAAQDYMPFQPSAHWAHGGPIIEREITKLFKNVGGTYTAQIKREIPIRPEDRGTSLATHYIDWLNVAGHTPLIAAMRCYVASKLGEEVEVPDELT